MSTPRAILLGAFVGLLPVALLLVATAGVADTPEQPEAVALAGEGALPGLYAAARATPGPMRPGALAGSWIHGLPLLPRLASSPPTPTPTPRLAPEEEELSPDELAAVESVARASVADEAQQAPASPTSGPLGKAVPATVRQWEGLIVRAAERTRLDPNLIAALMMTESGGNPKAVSPKGAVGLLQVMGGSFDPETNVQQGADILARHIARYDGRLDLALAAYNAGPGAVERYGGVPPYRETRDHVFRVLLRLDLYRAR